LLIEQRLSHLCAVLGDLQAMHAVFSWPLFSITSYFIVRDLKRQGILPKTVIDVGANVGQFAVASAKLFPDVQVHSCEPLPECVAKLRHHAKRLGNIEVYPVALGESSGEVQLHVNTHRHSSSILPLLEAHRLAFPKAQVTGSLAVELSTLDSVMANIELPQPCLLKIDVQGYESKVLRGAIETLSRIDHVILEASFKLLYEGESLFVDIVNEMADYGFRFLRPVGWLSHPVTGEILQMDALFVRKR